MFSNLQFTAKFDFGDRGELFIRVFRKKPQAVSDAGQLIHLAQISKLHLLKKIFKSILITPLVKRETIDEGIRLGHADATLLRKAVNEGWIVIEDLSEA